MTFYDWQDWIQSLIKVNGKSKIKSNLTLVSKSLADYLFFIPVEQFTADVFLNWHLLLETALAILSWRCFKTTIYI